MIVVMKPGSAAKHVEHVVNLVREMGLKDHVIVGTERTQPLGIRRADQSCRRLGLDVGGVFDNGRLSSLCRELVGQDARRK